MAANTKMFDPSKFTVSRAKPLPVYLLLDVSGSMSGSKIDNLNLAVSQMLRAFAEEEKNESLITVAVITFGGSAQVAFPPKPASEVVKWTDLQAAGLTPLGAALTIAKDMIEDKTVTPSRAYRPVAILVSDGQPNDEWEAPLNAFVKEGRSTKCDRLAMAIGSDADEDVLSRFLEGTPHQVAYAENAPKLHEFFKRLTMSVTMRCRSTNPNQVPDDGDIKLDGTIGTPGDSPGVVESAKEELSGDDYW